MVRWPLGDRKDDGRRTAYVLNKTCGDYIAASGSMVPEVTWAATELAKLQAERQVKVYITWPAVAGTDCYALVDGRLPIADEARKIFTRHGIAVVGEPSDSYFTPEHMLDTYYHVDSEAARVRTERLIGRLRTAGLKPDGTENKATLLLVSEALQRLKPAP